MSPVKWLALATCAVAACLGSAFPASAANIRGVVQFTGTGGEPKKLPVTIDQYLCGKPRRTPGTFSCRRATRSPTRSSGSRTRRPRRGPAGAPTGGTIDQNGCVFVPRSW